MLTRLLFLLGLICGVVWLVGRAWLMVSTPPPAELRFAVPGEALVRGLDAPQAAFSSAVTQAPPPAAPTAAPASARPATPMPLVAPTPGCFRYTVQTGDTPQGLAQRFDTSVPSLLEDNQLSGAARLRAGQRLALCPGPAAQTSPPAPRYRVYRVQPGDTLPSLALRFGVPVYTLAQTNNLPLSARLYAGQTLRLPDGMLSLVETASITENVPRAPSPTPSLPSSPPPRRVPVPQATEIVQVAWPRRVNSGQTVTVRLGFGRSGALPDVPNRPPIGALPTATPPLVFRVDRALAAAYEGVAVARLEGLGVEPTLLTPDAQSLLQADMGWAWTAPSLPPGRYQARASLEVRWTPRGGGQPIVHSVWQQPLDIEVVRTPLAGWLLNLPGLLALALLLLAGLNALRERLTPLPPRPRPKTRTF